jgi:AcrR family transcriptional regulator
VGHKHSRESLLAAAVIVAQDEGLHRLSFGRVATRAGTSDRVVVYYFPTKQALVQGVLEAVGAGLLERLGPVLDGARPSDHRELARLVWVAVGHQGTDPAVAVYVEALGLAAARTPPYPDAARAVAESWTTWFADHLPGTDGERRSEARAALALVDGLLLVRLAAGPEVAEDAARTLGVA